MSEGRLRTHDVILHGDRVVLRPMTEDDWELLLRWNGDPDVLWYCEGDEVTSRPASDTQDIYREVSRTAFCFIIEVDGCPIGEGWLQEMNYPRVLARYPGKDCRRIDLLIGERSRWGQGYGTDAIRALARFGFEREGADYLFACSVGDYNPRSRRAFERVGFAVDQVITERIGPKSRREYDLVLSRREYFGRVSPSSPTEAPIRPAPRG